MSLPLQTHSNIYPHPSFFEKSTAIPNSSLLAHNVLGEIEEVFIRYEFPQFLVTFSSFFLRTVSTCEAYPFVCSSDSNSSFLSTSDFPSHSHPFFLFETSTSLRPLLAYSLLPTCFLSWQPSPSCASPANLVTRPSRLFLFLHLPALLRRIWFPTEFSLKHTCFLYSVASWQLHLGW